MKWLCVKCQAVNPLMAPKCHNCGEGVSYVYTSSDSAHPPEPMPQKTSDTSAKMHDTTSPPTQTLGNGISEEELKRMAVAQYPDPEYKGGWHVDQVLNKRIGFMRGAAWGFRAALAKREG